MEEAVRLRDIQLANRDAEMMRVNVRPSRVDPRGALWPTALLQNYPSPFNPETWIPFDLAESANVSVDIMSMSGAVVRSIDLGWMDSGGYRSRQRAAYWDGRNEYGERVASGVYFYRIRAGSYSAGRKLVVLK